MEYGSKLLEKAVDHIAQLPGIGKRTALRLALHLLQRPETQTLDLSDALKQMRLDIKHCKQCNALSDDDLCVICADPRRDEQLICVVEDIRDVLAIEATAEYKGLYHVLGGKISPMDGIGPSDLAIVSLVERLKTARVSEVIFALSASMEGDTTQFYIHKSIKQLAIKCSALARGLAVGDELQYADEITLGRSISNRVLLSD
ncbi:MAG: recombination mediator RecR [Flavobacteriaceae bacterium]